MSGKADTLGAFRGPRENKCRQTRNSRLAKLTVLENMYGNVHNTNNEGNVILSMLFDRLHGGFVYFSVTFEQRKAKFKIT